MDVLGKKKREEKAKAMTNYESCSRSQTKTKQKLYTRWLVCTSRIYCQAASNGCRSTSCSRSNNSKLTLMPLLQSITPKKVPERKLTRQKGRRRGNSARPMVEMIITIIIVKAAEVQNEAIMTKNSE